MEAVWESCGSRAAPWLWYRSFKGNANYRADHAPTAKAGRRPIMSDRDLPMPIKPENVKSAADAKKIVAYLDAQFGKE